MYIFSDSVLCAGEMGCDPNAAWKNKIKWHSKNNHFKELNSVDGMQTELEWMFKKVYSVNLSISTAESSSCRSIMTLYGEKNGNTQKCTQNSINVSKCARKLLCGRWSFLGLGSEKKGYKTCSDKPDGNWDRTAEMMIL